MKSPSILQNANHDTKLLRKVSNAIAQRMRHVKDKPLTKENRAYILNAIELEIVKIQTKALNKMEVENGTL